MRIFDPNNFNNQFIELVQSFLSNILEMTDLQFKQIIDKQLKKMRIVPPIIPSIAMLNLPDDQYQCINRIMRTLGPNNGTHYPYFFITG